MRMAKETVKGVRRHWKARLLNVEFARDHHPKERAGLPASATRHGPNAGRHPPASTIVLGKFNNFDGGSMILEKKRISAKHPALNSR